MGCMQNRTNSVKWSGAFGMRPNEPEAKKLLRKACAGLRGFR